MIWRSRAKILGSEAKILLPDPFAPKRVPLHLFTRFHGLSSKIVTRCRFLFPRIYVIMCLCLCVS